MDATVTIPVWWLVGISLYLLVGLAVSAYYTYQDANKLQKEFSNWFKYLYANIVMIILWPAVLGLVVVTVINKKWIYPRIYPHLTG